MDSLLEYHVLSQLFAPTLRVFTDTMPYPHPPVDPSCGDCPAGHPPPSSSPSYLSLRVVSEQRAESDLWQRFSLRHANDTGAESQKQLCSGVEFWPSNFWEPSS